MLAEETFGQEDILVFFFFINQGGPDRDITYSGVVSIPATCLSPPSVMWKQEHTVGREVHPMEQS